MFLGNNLIRLPLKFGVGLEPKWYFNPLKKGTIGALIHNFKM